MDAGGTGRKQEEWEDRRNREMGLVCKIRLFKKRRRRRRGKREEGVVKALKIPELNK